MLINFKEIKVYKDLAKKNPVVMNIQNAIADVIYKQGAGAAGASMCTRIYESKTGIVEFSDSEVELFKNIIDNSNLFTFIVMSLHDIIKNGGNVKDPKEADVKKLDVKGGKN